MYGYIPIRLLEIEDLIVYHLQSNNEFMRQDPPKQVYWTNKARTEAFGPFLSIYKACEHYSWLTEQRKIEKSGNKTIRVDFVKKKRL